MPIRLFSEKPHIAGSPRQKKLADILKQRWEDYGFDKVEMPEYKVLLSFPQKDNPNTVTLFNGSTIVFNITGKEKVRLRLFQGPGREGGVRGKAGGV